MNRSPNCQNSRSPNSKIYTQEAQEMGMTLESAIQRILESLGGDKDYLRYRMNNPISVKLRMDEL